MNAHASGALLAILAAILFGVSTPLIARAGADVGTLSTAGLLYLGAALGAALARTSRRRALVSGRPLAPRDLVTIGGMALCGAVIAPVLLVLGLARTSSLVASLALNAEVFFTVVLAIAIYREPWRGRVALGMFAMLVGGGLLALDQTGGAARSDELTGLLLVIAATFAWGLDNTLSRSVSEASPLSVVALKGALGAAATLSLAPAFGESFPSAFAIVSLALIGATGYGASLVVYLLAQRRLGAARTGSIFGLAPFIGAALALALGERDAGWLTTLGAACFGVGVWIHSREPHAHEHAHEAIVHEHEHRHDDQHHGHLHDPPVRGAHSHPHSHGAIAHAHAHAPDLHHRHLHR